MLEDELNALIYIFAYPVSTIFNIIMDFIGVFLSVFLGIFVTGVGIINAFNAAIYGLVCITLPPALATIVLVLFYILGIYYLIKVIKMVWDVLPFA